MKKGDYYKLVGAFEGALWNGSKWERFECEACVRASGLVLNRLQGSMSEGASKAMLGSVAYRHDRQLHQQYLTNARSK